jgi:hypothetical protein
MDTWRNHISLSLSLVRMVHTVVQLIQDCNLPCAERLSHYHSYCLPMYHVNGFFFWLLQAQDIRAHYNFGFCCFGPSELDQWHIRKHESSPQWHRQTFNIQYTEWVKEVNKFLGFALHSNCRGVIRISFAPCSVQVYSPLSHGLRHHILDMLRVDAGVWNYC